jgi:Asp-tRNA(Asn)/Glu-tRNA(Gln) amidotransferase A subunit family amidase
MTPKCRDALEPPNILTVHQVGTPMIKYTRPDFIRTCAAGALAFPQTPTSRLETFSDWIKADGAARKRGLEQCLQTIREREPSIHAWVVVQPEQPTRDGPLAGIPFGVKDIVETKGMATEYGSPLYKGRLGTLDAAILRELRNRGAVLLGKTVTTAFAYRTPGTTRNPRNPRHTPGGSSSGSAAAVAAGMVPFTIGEQTRGSILRPASFCGVTGFKPTHDLLTMEGVLKLAGSLDTLGFFTRTPGDMLELWKAIGKPLGGEEQISFGAAEPIPDCDPDMANAFTQSIDRLRRTGVTVKPIDIADELRRLVEAARRAGVCAVSARGIAL